MVKITHQKLGNSTFFENIKTIERNLLEKLRFEKQEIWFAFLNWVVPWINRYLNAILQRKILKQIKLKKNIPFNNSYKNEQFVIGKI